MTARAIRRQNVAVLTDDGRRLVRACEDPDELVSLRATLRTAAAGRGRWLLWTWLLLLSEATVTADGSNATAAFFILPVLIILLLVIVSYVSKIRYRANNAEDWLSEIDYRLSQLAAKG